MLGDLNYRNLASPDEVLSLVAESMQASSHKIDTKGLSDPAELSDDSSDSAGESLCKVVDICVKSSV